MDNHNDTETLIALVASLLQDSDASFPQAAILDALVQCNGDATAAANKLLPASGSKRKRSNLDSWFNEHSSKRVQPPISTSNTPSKSLVSKPVTDLMSVLRAPPSTVKNIIRLPPLMLTTPQLVAEHVPCTLHPSVLPSDLACELFYTMLDASRGWKRNKWWLFDRVVESPHRTSFYARKTDGLDGDETWQEAARYWYNGRMSEPPPVFPPVMEKACKIVEDIVNEEMKKRKPFNLEWVEDDQPVWRANVAASNCYEGAKDSVGFHSDHLTYLGPYPTIASLSLGTRRNFSLREVIPTDERENRKARTFNIPLSHNSLTIMHASCQEKFKHSIPPQNAIDIFRPAFPRSPGESTEPSPCRINITFRFYRPDFRPQSIPRCKCGVPTILRPDMKNRTHGEADRYWWTCYAGAQNDGKGCDFWKLLDMLEEKRAPFTGFQKKNQHHQIINGQARF